MTTAYDLLGIGPDATRAELEAAYRAKCLEYAADRHADLPDEFRLLAAQRRNEFSVVYQQLRPALTAPPRLAPTTERRRDRETILALLLLVLLALTVPLLRGVAVPERTVVAEGAEAAALTSDAAPDFSLQTLDGETVRLSDFTGKVVLINFWATWCPPCVREIPRLVRISEEYDDDGLVVLGINTTFQDDPAKVEQFVRDQGISYRVLLDPDGDTSQKYPARLMPTTYLIDRSGKVVHTKVGEVDEATLDEQVQALLRAEARTP
ncbi:MAG TPA: redoxin domain-containing protein [Herpetosiphonaceae bacterium]